MFIDVWILWSFDRLLTPFFDFEKKISEEKCPKIIWNTADYKTKQKKCKNEKGVVSKERLQEKLTPPPTHTKTLLIMLCTEKGIKHSVYFKGLLFLESLTTWPLLPLLNIETTLCACISSFSPLTYIDIYLRADRLHSLQTHI